MPSLSYLSLLWIPTNHHLRFLWCTELLLNSPDGNNLRFPSIHVHSCFYMHIQAVSIWLWVVKLKLSQYLPCLSVHIFNLTCAHFTMPNPYLIMGMANAQNVFVTFFALVFCFDIPLALSIPPFLSSLPPLWWLYYIGVFWCIYTGHHCISSTKCVLVIFPFFRYSAAHLSNPNSIPISLLNSFTNFLHLFISSASLAYILRSSIYSKWFIFFLSTL